MKTDYKNNNESGTLSRNDPCWCGSEKKYKRCHMEDDISAGRVPRNLPAAPAGVRIKTSEEVAGVRKACLLVKETLDMIEEHIRPGISTLRVNDIIHEYTVKRGAVPAPLNYNGFPKSICTSVNGVVCHGIPDNTIIQDGDIMNVDVTSILNGYYGDAGRMFLIGNVSDEARKLVTVAKECLDIGISKVRPLNDIGEIGFAIERYANKHGFTVVRDYGGHGIGVDFHEEPHIHHFGTRRRGVIMVPNMIFTIEPMINQGRYDTKLMPDRWTAMTADGSLSAQWEHTVLVTDEGVDILTA